MSLTATARSIPGTLRQDVLVNGKFHLVTDEPESVGGEDSAPAPHELLPAALASCISTVLVMYARTKEWDLGEVSVAVDYDHHATPRRFDVSIALHGRPHAGAARAAREGRLRRARCGSRWRSAWRSSERHRAPQPPRRGPVARPSR